RRLGRPAGHARVDERDIRRRRRATGLDLREHLRSTRGGLRRIRRAADLLSEPRAARHVPMRPYHLAVLLMLSSACDADCDPASLTCSGFTRSSPAPQAPDASFEGVCEERDCVPIAIAAGAQHTCASILHDFVGSTAEGETV